MRSALREKQIEIFDAGLLPETEVVRLSRIHDTTIYEMARDPSVYNVAALLDAADLALDENAANLTQLRGMLNSEEIGERYWGMVGCFLLDDLEAGRIAIRDTSHEIRALAAWLLIRLGEKEAGYTCLRELLANRSYASLTILDIIDWMGDDRGPLMAAVREFDGKGFNPKQVEFVQEHLLERYGK